MVRDLSGRFARTYEQAMMAESNGLSELVGVGLRKALEFLVKDFVIYRHPDAEEQIKGTHLSKCIADYISNPSLRACAERAAWLGNDETHYLRVWVDRDVKDLKTLIGLTITHVNTELRAEATIEGMPKGGPPDSPG